MPEPGDETVDMYINYMNQWPERYQ